MLDAATGVELGPALGQSRADQCPGGPQTLAGLGQGQILRQRPADQAIKHGVVKDLPPACQFHHRLADELAPVLPVRWQGLVPVRQRARRQAA